jgi:hypothetical protein
MFAMVVTLGSQLAAVLMNCEILQLACLGCTLPADMASAAQGQ